MKKDYSLSIEQTANTITDQALAWRRSIRSVGGDWLGHFRLRGEKEYLQYIFDTHLGYQIAERVSGRKTWEGLIYEMEFNSGNVKRIISLDRSQDNGSWANEIRVSYRNTSGTETNTGGVNQLDSIAQFGTRQDRIQINNSGNISSSVAEAWRDTLLNIRAWPVPVITELRTEVNNPFYYIDITVAGYVFTMNWKYSASQSGSGTQNLSSRINYLVDSRSEFVNIAKIDTNTLQVARSSPTDTRAFDAIVSLVDLGDSNSNRYSFQVIPGRLAVYEKISLTPTYIWADRELVTQGGSELNQFEIRPAIVKDTTQPERHNLPNSWLSDSRDFYIDEISIGSRSGPSFSSRAFSENEILVAQREYSMWLEELTEAPNIELL